MSAIASNISTSLISSRGSSPTGLLPDMLNGVHHIALNVKDMQTACHFLWQRSGSSSARRQRSP